jgi:copper(I)-binding protein
VSLRLSRPATPALVLGLALVVTGCGANFEAQTYQTRASADATNAAVGAIALRNVRLLPPDGGTYDAGEDAEADLTLVNDGGDADRLVSVTSPSARSVEVLEGGEVVDGVDLPRLGTTGGMVGLRLTGLTDDLRPGRFVPMVFTFERNGEVTVQVPVETTGVYDEDREHSENFHPIGEEEGEGE